MTPMELQYLVGLCCLRRNPQAVEIVLGDMVLDEASKKPRDVDVTVRVTAEDGVVTAFQGIEVKQEAKPLDVATLEQLAIKLKDMPAVTHRAVVSASGFTDGAKSKAKHHGVELYEFVPWTGPIQETLPHWKNSLSPQLAMQATQWLLYWVGSAKLDLVVPDASSGFSVPLDTLMCNVAGAPHLSFSTFGAYRDELLRRSTGILCGLEPAATLLRLPPVEVDRAARACRSMLWAHTHTLDVASDGVFLALEGGSRHLTQVTISGHLYWECQFQEPEYKVLRRVGDAAVFASAMIALGRVPGELFCFVFDPTSLVSGVHFVHLTKEQQHILNRLSLRSASG
jgi:hypothetical protein